MVATDELVTEILREMLAYVTVMATAAGTTTQREREARVDGLFAQLDAARGHERLRDA